MSAASLEAKASDTIPVMLNEFVLAVVRAAEEHGEPAVHPWLVGAGALAILLLMLVGLIAFGGGRDHS